MLPPLVPHHSFEQVAPSSNVEHSSECALMHACFATQFASHLIARAAREVRAVPSNFEGSKAGVLSPSQRQLLCLKRGSPPLRAAFR